VQTGAALRPDSSETDESRHLRTASAGRDPAMETVSSRAIFIRPVKLQLQCSTESIVRRGS
jgi:hypothetical protein